MVKVCDFDNETEAHLARSYLQSKDISAEVVGAREYTAHLLGGGAGHFELMVDPINLNLARDLLSHLPKAEVSEVVPPNYFRRAVFYAIIATIILPIVFNYASINQARLFWKNSPKNSIAMAQLALIVVLQILPLAVAILFLRSWTRGETLFQ